MAVRSILKVDPFRQTVTTIIWMRVYWIDEFIQWNPEEYHGIKSQTLSGQYLFIQDQLVRMDFISLIRINCSYSKLRT